MSVYTAEYGAFYAGAPILTVRPGQVAVLSLVFLDEATGLPADPTSVQLDITYGTEVGLTADVAGPFFYTGAMAPVYGQVYRTGEGLYSFSWQVPANALGGIYVANWTTVYGGLPQPLAVENFVVLGGSVPVPVPGGDIGFWTGSLSYNGNSVQWGAVDGNGITWLFNKLEGWDGPDVSGGIIQRSGDHGGWASPQYFAPRNMTLTLTASAPTQALRDLARELLSQVVPVSDLATFVHNEPVPKQAMIRRSGKIPESYPTLTDVQFTIGMLAPDPRKYTVQTYSVTTAAGAPSSTGLTFPLTFPITWPPAPPAGIAVVENFGNFETRPLITITGPVTSPALINLTTGQVVSWTGLVVPAGATLAVDFLNRQATTAAGSYAPADVTSSWWVMQPGTTEIELGGQPGTGAQFTTFWRSAFI